MRYLLALVLAANVGYFAWEYTREPASTRGVYPPPEADRLVLLAERDRVEAARGSAIGEPDGSGGGRERAGDEPAPSDAPASPPDGPSPPASELDLAGAADQALPAADQDRSEADDADAGEQTASADASAVACYRLGPYFDRPLADRAATALERHGVEVRRERGEVDRLFGYWVYIPPRDDNTAARRVAEDLAANGLQDYFVVLSEELENAISVGIFSQPESAQRRREQIAGFGYDTEIEPRFREAHATWLDVRVPSDVALDEDAWRVRPEQMPALERRERECGGGRD